MPDDEKYEPLEKIGHGSFGVIRKVKRKADNHILCRKEISYSKMSQKEREQLQAELSILKELRHPNIVAYYEREHIKATQDLYLYMEFCGNGDLGKVIQNLKAKNQLADEEFVWSIVAQLLSALYRCHYGVDAPPAGGNVMGLGAYAKPPASGKPMILHRDLKPENIFLGKDNSVKLGDFGLSKILQSHDFASTYVGTPFYMSPEICKAESYTLYSDIWALGCIVYELCAKVPPFNAKTHFDLIQKIKAGRYPPIPSCYSAELGKLISSCLQVVPSMRPDTAQLLNLPIVKLMRKEQEVVKLGQELREQKAQVAGLQKELETKVARQDLQLQEYRKETDNSLRREWEVKARLEIDRQVSLELNSLREKFEGEVAKRVAQEVAKIQQQQQLQQPRLSTSPKLAPRSSTPTQMPAEQSILFPTESDKHSNSTSTTGTSSDFPSGTDLSSLSLDSPEDAVKPVPAPTALPTKKATRAPMSRARTMFAAPVAAPAPPSPMDVHMVGSTPAPVTISSLSLSPRRAAPRGNIFAAAKDKDLKKWETDALPSPTDESWNADIEDDDDTPVLPSPTRSRSNSGDRDPFKVLAQGQRPLVKTTQRLGSAPNLAKPLARPASAVPVVSKSPERRKVKTDSGNASPTRKTASVPSTTTSGGLKSKKGNEQIRIQAMRNNGVQGRTLVELQQARGIPTQAMSEDEGKRGLAAPRSPTKIANFSAMSPAKWNPETDDMPSPFLVKTRRLNI